MWIEKENYLNETLSSKGDGSFYDYLEIDDEERGRIFVIWSILLYQKICSNLGDDTIRYIGGVEQWKRTCD